MLAAVAAAAAALVPAVFVASPALATNTTSVSDLTISTGAANWEGGKVSFTLTYTGASAGTYAISTGVTGIGIGNATSGGDFDATPSRTTVTFPGTATAGAVNTTTVTVTTMADVFAEGDETFNLIATDDQTVPGAGTLDAVGTIWNVDTSNAYTLTGPGIVSETATTTGTGTSAVTTQATATVSATMTTAQPHDVVIPVQTVDDTARSDVGVNRDYTALPTGAAITVPAGQLSGSISVSLWDDNVNEDPVQNFDVVGDPVALGAVAAMGGDSVTVGIRDDDPMPSVHLGNAGGVVEGGTLGFPVILSNPSERNVTVHLATSDGDATDTANPASSPSDYTSFDSTFTIPNLATTATKLIQTTADPGPGTVEGPENVKMTLSAPVGASLGSPTTATGIIRDAQGAPSITVDTVGQPNTVGGPGSTSFTEGDTDEVSTYINVNLSSSTTVPVKLNYSFADGTATNGVDYRGAPGSITIAAGETTAAIPVTIIGDKLYEYPDETFNVNFTSPNNSVDASSLLTPQTITIADSSDTQPTWSVGDVLQDEGNSGQTMARVPITLSALSNQDNTFNVTLTDGTANEAGINTGSTAGADDYDSPASRVVTIPAGSLTGYLDVPINGDTVYERDETITAGVTRTGGNILDTIPAGMQHSSTITIKNDDAAPTMTFNETSASEGTSVRVNGTIVGSSQRPYTVKFAVAGSGTAPDAATSGTDFDKVTIADVPVTRGQTGALAGNPLATIFFNPDNIDEPTESLAVTASESTPSPIGFASSTGTYKILDGAGDLPPAASVHDETIKEGEGSVDVQVDLAFTGDTKSTTQTVTVPYFTQDGSAKAGQDYTETKGTLSFAPGEMSKTINVPIKKDGVKEGNEDFYVKLGTPGPAGAAITKGAGDVIILANDGGSGTTPPPSNPGAPSIMAPAWVTGSIAVPVTGKADPGATVDLWGGPWSPAMPKLVKIDSVTADSSGNYKFARWIGTGYRFQTAVGDKMSDEIKVGIDQAPVFVASSPSKGKLSLAIQGNPRGPKQVVIVQVLSHGKWVNTWRGTTVSNNLWKATVSEKSKSSWTLRAFVQGDMNVGVNGGYSAAKKITIK
ncbi:Calx-beta domain-containing protein [Actinoplanes sp. NPDC051411]|uniref:Calx-beta domain-containing protein n=1 Tax=Actinoplanes sp. NPDC051411 TaxID=3155522 RepID=UPI003422BB03